MCEHLKLAAAGLTHTTLHTPHQCHTTSQHKHRPSTFIGPAIRVTPPPQVSQMEKERRVEMVRLEREEVYDVEEVFGRDASSVFPKAKAAAAKADGEAGALSTDMVREMLGGRKFVTESELEAIRATKGGDDPGNGEPLKPLVEVLREAKEKKEQAFADGWKQMKTGKNRPLDADELEFLDAIAEEESRRYKEQVRQEQQELEEFRRAAASLAEASGGGDAGAAAGGEGGGGVSAGPRKSSLQDVKKAVPVKPLIRAVVKPKRKDSDTQPPQQQPGAGTTHQGSSQEQQGHGSESGVKRVKLGSGDGDDAGREGNGVGEDKEEGLAGLLGGYGSGSDSDT